MKSYILIGVAIILVIGIAAGYLIESKGTARDKALMEACIERFGGSDAPPCAELTKRYHERGLR
jgi:hypothetical protein